jgi:hypothetical protein
MFTTYSEAPMTRHDIQSITCAALWTGAGALAILASVRTDMTAMFWAIEVTTLALLPSVLLMVEDVAKRERLRVEELGDLIAESAIRQCNEERVTRLR